MALRASFENKNEVGVFALFTNKYAIVATGGTENFYAAVKAQVGDYIPIVHTLIGGTKLVGRTCVGNKNGLLVSALTTDSELQHLRNSLPDDVKIQRVEERLSALGNCIVMNDYVALVHTDLDRETEEIIADVCGVEVFRTTVANNVLVGSYVQLNNMGCLVPNHVGVDGINEIANILQLPTSGASVNRGSDLLGASIVCNDFAALVGGDSTATEVGVVESVLKLGSRMTSDQNTTALQHGLIDQ